MYNLYVSFVVFETQVMRTATVARAASAASYVAASNASTANVVAKIVAGAIATSFRSRKSENAKNKQEQ